MYWHNLWSAQWKEHRLCSQRVWGWILSLLCPGGPLSQLMTSLGLRLFTHKVDTAVPDTECGWGMKWAKVHERPGRAGAEQTFDTEKTSVLLSPSHWVAQGFQFSIWRCLPTVDHVTWSADTQAESARLKWKSATTWCRQGTWRPLFTSRVESICLSLLSSSFLLAQEFHVWWTPPFKVHSRRLHFWHGILFPKSFS